MGSHKCVPIRQAADRCGSRCGHGGGAFLFPWVTRVAVHELPGACGPGKGEPAALQVTFLGEGLEAPGDASHRGVKAAPGGEALVAGDARVATVLPVLGTPAGALAGSCGEGPSASPRHARLPQGALGTLLGSCCHTGAAKSCLAHV